MPLDVMATRSHARFSLPTLLDSMSEGTKRLNAHLAPGVEPAKVDVAVASPKPRGGRGPNKTEAEFAMYYLRGKDARYEALTFRMANGHRYTPDWVVWNSERLVLYCYEVKGAHAFHSQRSAKLAFDQAKIEFPWVEWIWATKTKDGWVIT